MSACKILFFLLLALCVLCGTCEVLYSKAGSTVSMDCGFDSNSDVEWKFNNILIFTINGRSGAKRRGNAHMVGKVSIAPILKISNLETRDSGVYTCTQMRKEFTLRVVSVFVNPNPVLVQSSNAELHCDITGSKDTKVRWIKPNDQPHNEQNQVLHLKSVTSAENGQWTCEIHNNFKLTVTLTIVALQTKDVEVSEGVDVVLPCSLSHPVSQRIVGGEWKTDKRPKDFFPTLNNTDGKGLHWNGKDSSKVRFTSGQLSTNFSVTLMNVQRGDQGVYECTVEFEGGVKPTAKMSLTVLQKPSGGQKVNTAKGKTIADDGTLTKEVFGVQLWIWIAVGASSVVLIGLLVITILVHRRNKRMKMRVRKLRSVRQPLTAKDYCQCHRNEREIELGLQETALALPRQHRNPRPAKSPNHTSDRTGLVY